MSRASRLNERVGAVDAASGYLPGAVPSYITGTHSRGYDRRLTVYNFKPTHLRKYRAKMALARVGAGQCSIMWAGTSLVAGEAATPFKDNAPPVRLRGLLSALLGVPIGGTGLVLDRNGASGNDGRISASGTWGLIGGPGIVSSSTVDASWKQMAADQSGTVGKILYRDNGTGQVKTSVDGGTTDQETITGTNTNNLVLKSYSGLSSATRSLRFTKVGTSAGPQIAGYANDGTTGLIVSSGGVGGSTSADWANTNTVYPGPIVRAYGGDLWLLDVLTNDVIQGVPVSTYKANMQTLITATVAAGAPDIVLIATIPKGATDDAAHRTALYELADENDLPLIDVRDRWGTADLAYASGLMQSDKIHGTAGGYFDLALAVASVLTGVS